MVVGWVGWGGVRRGEGGGGGLVVMGDGRVTIAGQLHARKSSIDLCVVAVMPQGPRAAPLTDRFTTRRQACAIRIALELHKSVVPLVKNKTLTWERQCSYATPLYFLREALPQRSPKSSRCKEHYLLLSNSRYSSTN